MAQVTHCESCHVESEEQKLVSLLAKVHEIKRVNAMCMQGKVNQSSTVLSVPVFHQEDAKKHILSSPPPLLTKHTKTHTVFVLTGPI